MPHSPRLGTESSKVNSLAAYRRAHWSATPTPSIALRMHPIAHPFRSPQAPRSVSPLNSRICETRGLPVLIAAHRAHAVLWPTWRLCSFLDRQLQEFSAPGRFTMIPQRRPLHCHPPHPCSLIWVADTGPGLCRLLGTFRRTLLLQSINIVPPIARVFAHVT